MGAHEIDIVLNRSLFLGGRYAQAFEELVAAREAAGAAHLKVILEVGELGSYDRIRQASMLAMAAGADFIKTSTGKIGVNATLPNALCMLEAARDFHRDTGREVGIKVAGGVRKAKQSIQYLVLVHETLGPDVDDARAVPDRRLVAAERRADADRQGADGPLPGPRLLHDRLMSEPAYVVENERELARLRAFVGSASDEQLATPMPDGWTVGSVLAHAAFWDGRVFAIMEARDGGMQPPPYHEEAVDWINDAAKPFLLALAPREPPSWPCRSPSRPTRASRPSPSIASSPRPRPGSTPTAGTTGASTSTRSRRRSAGSDRGVVARRPGRLEH